MQRFLADGTLTDGFVIKQEIGKILRRNQGLGCIYEINPLNLQAEMMEGQRMSGWTSMSFYR